MTDGAPLLPVGRRRVRVQGASSAGLALVLLLGLLATTAPPERPADRTIVAAPPPVQAAAAPPRQARAPLPAARSADGPRRDVRSRQAAPARQRRAAAPPAKVAPRARVAQRAHAPMVLQYEREAHGESVCPAGTDGTPLGLTCRDADVRTGAGAHELRFRVCPTTAARFELRFATEQEVAMTVRDSSGRAVWTWRPRTPFRDHAHVLVSEVGACWLWATPWAQVDDGARPLPPGRYALQVDFLETEDPRTYTRSFHAR